jgi:hypothetical protein
MSYDEHIVCLAIVNELVCPLEVELSLNRLQFLALHAVLCHDRIEVLLYWVKGRMNALVNHPCVESASDIEFILESILHAWSILCECSS